MFCIWDNEIDIITVLWSQTSFVENDVVTSVKCNSVVMLFEFILVCVVGREM